MMTIALLGAGGKMGLRCTDNLKNSDYRVHHVEVSETGRAALADRGVQAVPLTEALSEAAAVILAIPDLLIGRVSQQVVPMLKPGTIVVILDAAAPYAGQLPDRKDISYFVTHPCHPPVFNDETDPEARRDFFGGIKAKQHIVCALMQGPEEAYSAGEKIARTIFAPVMRAHRCTMEQIAILEPALSETVAATCIVMIREAMDEAIRRGVPAEAARDFLLGHINIELALVFEELKSARFSDGALKAIEEAKTKLFRPDWKRVFEPEEILESVSKITGADAAAGAQR
jgi:D-apionate oxidoisomerase